MLSNILGKPLIKELVAIALLVLCLHVVAVYFYLYWSIDEFDSVMHFLGGALVALFFVYLYFVSGAFVPKRKGVANYILISLLGLVFVGVSWEIYELLYGLTYVTWADYASDTALDFVMDTLGGVSAALYGYIRVS